MKTVYYWSLRLNWRAGFCMVVWFGAPYAGLDSALLPMVQNAAATFLVAAFLDWARKNGRRGEPQIKRRDIGVVGTRHEGADNGGV